MSVLTAARLREVLDYDPETGRFRRRARAKYSAWYFLGGKRTGSPYRSDKRYLRIMVDGQRHFAHRLAFLYMTGEWPPEQVDHINGDGSDNRWVNLRAATQSENLANGRPRARNAIGFRGVSRHREKFSARITHNGRRINLGDYATPEEAAAAYQEAARTLFGKFAR